MVKAKAHQNSNSKSPSDERALWNAAYEARYQKLNKEQKKAVDAIEGPVLVVAGPGSGKTEILSLRVGNILRTTDVRPSNILCLTFTESAALNMRERLANLIGPDAYRVAIYTFHSFGTELIRRYPEFFYGGAFFTPADPITVIDVLEELLEKLPHDNPLRTVHPEQGFVYLASIREAFSSLKKAGITPDEYSRIVEKNATDLQDINVLLASVFTDRLSMKQIGDIENVVRVLKENGAERDTTGETALPLPYRPIAQTVADSLAYAVEQAQESEKTAPLSAWKEKYIKKDDAGNRVFRDSLYIEKSRALANLYREYREIMYAKGFYDFDDMLLDVISALKQRPTLRYEIQEQFQYVLVDEFQDTNNAQMRIITLLGDAEVNERRPNIMAVGDDDQAIYKFQGAEISNILDFERLFREPTIITMTGNYRSTQPILDVARAVILKGEDRLEKRIPGMDKTLTALGVEQKKPTEGTKDSIQNSTPNAHVIRQSFPTQAHELTWIAQDIARRLQNKQDPNTIAVITRRHAELEALVPYMRAQGIPIRYEREQNVFEEPHIRELIILARYTASALSKDISTADSLLPTILSFPFWGLSRETVWNIAVKARTEHIPWLDAMSRFNNDAIVMNVRHFLLDMVVVAQNEPLEKMLDHLIGAHVPLIRENENEDEEELLATNTTSADNAGFKSPFREFYFSRQNFESKRADYLGFLSSLRVFIAAIRQFRQGTMLSISDLVDFVEIHEKNNIPLHDTSPFASALQAVTLLTAHKAKGLEFETVFVVSCQEDVWSPRGHSSYLPFPINVQIAPAGDTTDDKLRLFYVALTRARQELVLTSYDTDEKGVASAHVSFLHGINNGQVSAVISAPANATGFSLTPAITIPDTHDVLTASWLSYHTPPFFGEERALLASLLKDYKMSVTHLNNFLNVQKGGPQCFLEQNLLRFPQAKTPSSAYGSAIHAVIERIYTFMKMNEGALPPLEQVIKWFEERLSCERLAPVDHTTYGERGRQALSIWFTAKKNTFSTSHLIEVDFSKQGVVVDGAIITGKIDKMIVSEDNIEVHDFKTGKPKASWDGKDEREKIQLYEYRRQLIFYKLLVEGSRDWGEGSAHAKKVTRGVLEFIETKQSALKNDGNNTEVIDLILDITDEEVDRVKALARTVYGNIINLNFPDISKYPQTLTGIKAFEDDLLAGQ